MDRGLQPIYCLSDSQLLFWRQEGDDRPWLHQALLEGREPPVRAAYVGASNGDEPAFYAIFAAAMESLGVTAHRMILSRFGDEDRDWLGEADLVLLAGGDPVRGWRIFEQSGLGEAIAARHFAGATLIGVSAGAVQLGWLAAPEREDPEPGNTTVTFRLVPAVVGVHQEAGDWRELRRLLRAADVPVRGLGIPTGGGLVYHPDGVVQPVRHPVHELVPEEDGLHHSLLFPDDLESIAGPIATSGVH